MIVTEASLAEHGIEEPFKSHRMRHTVLTLLNNSRLADDKSLQAWAGHRDAAFTRRQYMTPQEEQLQTVGNGFSEYGRNITIEQNNKTGLVVFNMGENQ